LLHALRKNKIEPEDIFVLAASVKNKSSTVFGGPSPMQQLENLLVQAGVPVFASNSDLDSTSDEQVAGKCVFTTFHSAKGLERKVVVVFGFNDSYFTFHARDHEQHVCPNALYVAATRASQWLLVVAESTVGCAVAPPSLRPSGVACL